MILPIFFTFWTWLSQSEAGSDNKEENFKKGNYLIFVYCNHYLTLPDSDSKWLKETPHVSLQSVLLDSVCMQAFFITSCYCTSSYLSLSQWTFLFVLLFCNALIMSRFQICIHIFHKNDVTCILKKQDHS